MEAVTIFGLIASAMSVAEIATVVGAGCRHLQMEFSGALEHIDNISQQTSTINLAIREICDIFRQRPQTFPSSFESHLSGSVSAVHNIVGQIQDHVQSVRTEAETSKNKAKLRHLRRSAQVTEWGATLVVQTQALMLLLQVAQLHSNDERTAVLEKASSRNVLEKASSMSAKLTKSSSELDRKGEFIKFPFDSVLMESKVYRRNCESSWIREVSTALKDGDDSNSSGLNSIMPASSNSAIASEGDCASSSGGISGQGPSDLQNLTTPEFSEDTYSSPGPPTLELSATDSSEQTGESSTTNPTTKSTLATKLSSIDGASAGQSIGRNGEDNPEHSSPTYVVSVFVEDIGTDSKELAVHEQSDHYNKTQEAIHHIRDCVLLAGGVDPGSYCGVCVSSTIETRGQSELHRFPLTPEFLTYAVDKVRDGFYESFEILARFASGHQSRGAELSSSCSKVLEPETKSWEDLVSELKRPVDLLRKLISKRGKPRHSDIPSEAIAPFIESSEPEYRVKGGFSDVYKVKINPTHLDWPADQDDQDKFFALKCFRRSDSAATMYRKEVQAFKAISSPGHPHLIELFGTYHWRGFDHLLFSWADGNLQDFWKSHPSPLSSEKQLELDFSPTRRMLDQCLGLAEALDQIHLSLNPGRDAAAEDAGTLVNYGRHGDIKPQNILWFREHEGHEERHIFKIADFGLAEFHHSMIDRIGPDIRGYTPTYGAPEFEHRSKGQRIDSSCDIWSLGCVFSEVATWVALGQEGVAAYRLSRYKHSHHGKFYEAEDGNVAISQPILRQLKMLRQSIPGLLDPHLSEGLGPELDQFMDTTVSCLAINGRERPSAAKVASMLQTTPLAMWLSRSPECPQTRMKEVGHRIERSQEDVLFYTSQVGHEIERRNRKMGGDHDEDQ